MTQHRVINVLFLGFVLAVVVCGFMYGKRRPREQSAEQDGLFNEPAHFPLSGEGLSAEDRLKLHPWIAGFLGLTPAEATKRLHERWASISRPSLVELRAVLSTFEVREIVVTDEGGYIRAERPGTPQDNIGNFYYLPAPMPPKDIQTQLAAVKLADNEVLAEFLLHFGGLSEDLSSSGGFIDANHAWETFDDSWDGTIKGFDEWEHTLMLYHARNGCCVLVHPNGKVAWWVMQEHFVAPLADSLDDFVRQFSAHRRLAWPYDPYGPPEGER